MTTSITHRNPFQDVATMRREVDRLWDDYFEVSKTRRLWPQSMSEFDLALDMAEDDDAYTVKASISGIDPDDIEVTIVDNTLTIKGECREEKEVEEKDNHLRERSFGSFMRSMTLPTSVDANAVEATDEHGVLTLRLSKVEES